MKAFYYVLGGVAVAGITWLGWQMAGPAGVSIPANVTVMVADTTGFRGYVYGSDSAPVTIVEYADFQCPGCASFDAVQWPTVYEQLVATGKARFIYRDYPLDNIHRHARLASHAAACANDQGKFGAMKQRLYAYQPQWAFGGGQYGKFRDYAQAAGVEVGAWEECMESAKYAGRIQASLDEALRVGAGGTPTFLIEGRLYSQIDGSDDLRRIVDSLIAARSAR
jgi:protein-disulfide isomerase